MDQEKVVVNCPNCNNALRFPVTDKKIRFACPACKTEYHAINGQIIEPEPEIIEDCAPADSVPETEPVNEPITAKKIRRKKERPAIENNAWPNMPITTHQHFWKWVSGVLFVAVLVLAYLVIFRYRQQDVITSAMLSSVKPGSEHDLEYVERNMTPETRSDFRLLMESQYNSGDSLASRQADHFLNSLEPMEYLVSRRFRYLTPKNDTAYFIVNFVSRHDTALVQVDMQQFLK